MRPSPLWKLLCLLPLLACAGCHNDTTRPPFSPWDGVWDVTTVLQTYNIEVGCYQFDYCTASYPAGAGSLHGTLALHLTPSDTTVSATLIGQFCDSLATTGCVHAGPPSVAALTGTLAITVTPGTDVSIDIPLSVPGVDYTIREHVYLSHIVAAGDSIYGNVYWARYVARNPPHYIGTFLGRRHPIP